MHDVQFVADSLLKAEQSGDSGIPDDAVEVAIGFGIGLRTTVTALPIALLDLVHQVLIVRVDHQRQPGLAHLFERAKKIAVIVKTDAWHVG